MTKFGKPKREVDIQIGDENGVFDYINPDFFEEIAIRMDGGKIIFVNPLYAHLNQSMRVYALDNNHQGIYTIGDICKEIDKQHEQNIK